MVTIGPAGFKALSALNALNLFNGAKDMKKPANLAGTTALSPATGNRLATIAHLASKLLDIRDGKSHTVMLAPGSITSVTKTVSAYQSGGVSGRVETEEVHWSSGVTMSLLDTERTENGLTQTRSIVDVHATSRDEIIDAISYGRREVSIHAGGGTDTVNIIAGATLDVHGDRGADTLNIMADNAKSISGDAGNDIVNVAADIASAIEGGEGNDIISVGARKTDAVYGGRGADTIYISGGDHVTSVYGDNEESEYLSPAHEDAASSARAGDDVIDIEARKSINIVGAGAGDDTLKLRADTVQDVSAGQGNDLVTVSAREISRLRGGAGDDTITLKGAESAHLVFGKGDGRDLVTISGATTIELENGLQMEDAIIARNDKTITITFKNSDDKIVINHAYGNFESDDGPSLETVGNMLKIT
jgi:hypothetical protein